MGLGFQSGSVSRKNSHCAVLILTNSMSTERICHNLNLFLLLFAFYIMLFVLVPIFFSYSLLWGVVCFNTASSLEMVCFQWDHLRQTGELTCRLTWPCVLSLAMHLGCLACLEMVSDWRIGTTLCIFKHVQQKFSILCGPSHCLAGASLLRSTIVPQG